MRLGAYFGLNGGYIEIIPAMVSWDDTLREVHSICYYCSMCSLFLLTDDRSTSHYSPILLHSEQC